MQASKDASRGAKSKAWIWQSGIAVLAVVVGVGGWWYAKNRDSNTTEAPQDAARGAATVAGGTDSEPRDVTLTPEKLEKAGLKLARAAVRPFRETRSVPGEIDYDGGKRVDVSAPVDGVIKRVLVEPGQRVRQGTPLVVMSSSEVGLARVNVSSRAADLQLAQQEHVWAQQIAENVDAMLKWLGSRPKITEIEERFANRPLGDYREKLMAAYSKLLFAESSAASVDLDDRGGIARRVVEERRSNREVAAATFHAACETAQFEARQAQRRTQADLAQAERMLAVARESLVTLLGPETGAIDSPAAATDSTAAPTPSANPPIANPPAANPTDDVSEGKDRGAANGTTGDPAVGAEVSEFTVLAPFDGRIEERQTVISARVKAGDTLFTLADTSTLWVKAEIHERDWKSLRFASSGSIPVRVPALGDTAFSTQVRYVGARVSPVSRSVPLVTELPNERGEFKPGMFVWVDAPLEELREALVVPAGAVMRQEGRPFVFVPQGERKFLRVDVETGLESTGYIEILRGLERDQEVVDHGAFFLKSELLLEREAE